MMPNLIEFNQLKTFKVKSSKIAAIELIETISKCKRIRLDLISSELSWIHYFELIFKMIQLDWMQNESSWCNSMWKWEILNAEWIKSV